MENFNELINGDKVVLADFYAEWCGPCKKMEPELEKLGEKLKDKAVILKVNVDNNLDLVKEYKIMGVPTLIIFKNGEIKWREAGVFPNHILEEAINNCL